MKASDLFVKCLEAEGVDYIFGLPGEENADIMMSLLSSKIQFILTRHEQSAAFMADVYGRLTDNHSEIIPLLINHSSPIANSSSDVFPLTQNSALVLIQLGIETAAPPSDASAYGRVMISCCTRYSIT